MRDWYVIKALIITDSSFLEECICKLHEQQTDQEQAIMETNEENGIGFNKADSRPMSGYADLLKAGVTLTHSQTADAQRRITKYITQLQNLLEDED